MIERLKISNYALIDILELEIGSGLTIITGETGAGKSIMLGALSLLSGGKGEARAVGRYGQKAVVEAVFGQVGNLSAVLEENGIDVCDDGRIILRREITAAGRSRAFVNDTPVTLSLLGEISSRLIDIHSQHSNRLLQSQDAQLRMIDAYDGDTSLFDAYREGFRRYVGLRGKIRRAREEMARERQNREMIAYQLEQLDKLNPKRGEFAAVEKEYDMLTAADEIRENLGGALRLLGDGEQNALDSLRQSLGLLEEIDMSLLGEADDENGVCSRLSVMVVELKDIVETIERHAGNIEANPARLDKVASRMKRLIDARRHFHLEDADELVDLRLRLREQYDRLTSGDSGIEALETEARQLAQTLKRQASEISARRRRSAEALEKRIVEMARPLGLPNIRFEVGFVEGKLTADGGDRIDFLCSFNKNGQLQSVGKVASGGEMSRLMLCIKAIMADRIQLPTVIFDEIDTGVSGEIADRMGKMMTVMSEAMQVLSITHLPQVAAKGDLHFKVYKEDTDCATVTHVRQLTSDQRVEEIARMLSGASVTEAAMENARWLLRDGLV